MAETIDSLLVSLGLETDKKSFEKANAAINGVKSGILQMAAAAGVGTSFHALTAGLSASVLEMDRLAKATGFTIRQIEQLRHSFDFNGLNIDSANGFVQKLKSLRDTWQTEAFPEKAFLSKAFSPTEFITRYDNNPITAVEYLITSMGAERNDTIRNQVLSSMGFGVGSDDRKFIDYGIGNYNKSKSKFDEYYKGLDQSLIDSANKFNEELASLKVNFTTLQRQIGGPLLESVTSFLKETNKFVKDEPEKAKKAAEIASLWGGAGVLKMLRVPGADKITGKTLGVWSLLTMEGYSADKYPGGSVEVRGTQANEQRSMEYWLRRKLGDWGFMSPMQDPNQYAQSSNANDINNLLSNPNIQKYLNVIALSEGTAGYANSGYNTMFGGDQISDMSDHPRILKEFTDTNGKKNKTSAAGRYQFTQASWDEAKAALNLPDFSPRSQDMAALYLIQRAGQLDNVKNGNFSGATANLGGTWASFASSTYAQPKHSYEAMENFYAMSNTPPSFSRSSDGSRHLTVNNQVSINAPGANPDEIGRIFQNQQAASLEQALAQTNTEKY